MKLTSRVLGVVLGLMLAAGMSEQAFG